tara:strand:+ start:200 stop:352 length:153 start_codon:yes stop_codon:yes gene_type:complete
LPRKLGDEEYFIKNFNGSSFIHASTAINPIQSKPTPNPNQINLSIPFKDV